MNEWTELDFVKYLIEQMEELKDDPDREKYCVGFDVVYENRKQKYFGLTGSKWEKESRG